MTTKLLRKRKQKTAPIRSAGKGAEKDPIGSYMPYFTSQSRGRRRQKAALGQPAGEGDRKNFTNNYLPYLLARASVLMGGEFHAQLPKGMGVPQWRVLAVLADHDSMTIGSLAKIVLLQQPTLTKVVDRLQAERLVDRGFEAEDKRRVAVSITPAGAAKVRPLIERAKILQESVLKNFNGHERQILFGVLHNLIDRILPDD